MPKAPCTRPARARLSLRAELLAADYAKNKHLYLSTVSQADDPALLSLVAPYLRPNSFVSPSRRPTAIRLAVAALQSTRGGNAELIEALCTRQKLEREGRRSRRVFEGGAGIPKSPAPPRAFSPHLILVVDKLLDAYPSKLTWVADSRGIAKEWRHPIEKGKRADKRDRRRPLTTISSKSLRFDIPSEVSADVTDRSTGDLVLSIRRDACADPVILKFVIAVVLEIIAWRRNVRKGDRGRLSQVGVTAGSRSRPSFRKARNIVPRRSVDEVRAHEERVGAMLALVWALMTAALPDFVVDDVSSYYQATGLPLFEVGDPTLTPPPPEITINHPSGTLATLPRPPGSAVAAKDYARFAHKDLQHHLYALGFNCSRTGGDEGGGHFHLPDYGLRFRASSNSVWAWRTSKWHATSLLARACSQLTVAFVTPPRLASSFATWKAARRRRRRQS